MSTSDYILITLVMLLLGAALTAISKIYNRLREAERGLALLQQQSKPFFKAMEDRIGEILHHDQYPEMDILITKLKAAPFIEMSHKDRIRMEQLLLERTTDMGAEITENERKLACIMPTIMELVLGGNGMTK